MQGDGFGFRGGEGVRGPPIERLDCFVNAYVCVWS